MLVSWANGEEKILDCCPLGPFWADEEAEKADDGTVEEPNSVFDADPAPSVLGIRGGGWIVFSSRLTCAVPGDEVSLLDPFETST